jgi:hypothetical protein
MAKEHLMHLKKILSSPSSLVLQENCNSFESPSELLEPMKEPLQLLG